MKASICVFLLFTSAAGPAFAQVKFQPPGCEFLTVFVQAPDVSNATVPSDDGHVLKETMASLEVVVDGQPNFFRAECGNVQVPARLDQDAMLDDMRTLARKNGLKDSSAWIETTKDGLLTGRARGQLTDSAATYVIDLHRFVGKHSLLDVWVASPPGVFPSRGNLIFLKEIRLNGKPIY